MSRVQERLNDIPSEVEIVAPPKPVARPKLVEVKSSIPNEPPSIKPSKPKSSKKLIYSFCGICVLLIAGLGLKKYMAPAPPPPVVVAEPISVSKSVEALTSTDKWAEAIPILEKAMASEPKNADILVLLALAKKKTSDLQGAKLLLEKAIVLNPEEPVAHNNLGLVFAALGSWDLAIGSYENALKLRANYSDAEMNAARAYEATKQWKKAISSYERFLSQNKDNIDLRKKIETRMRRLNSFSINPPKTASVEGEKI